MGAEDVVVELIAVDIGDIRPQHECRLISQLYPLQYRRLTRRQLNRVWFRSNQHTNRLFDIFERGFHLSAVDQGVPTTAGGQRPPAPQRVGQWHRLRRLTASKWKPPFKGRHTCALSTSPLRKQATLSCYTAVPAVGSKNFRSNSKVTTRQGSLEPIGSGSPCSQPAAPLLTPCVQLWNNSKTTHSSTPVAGRPSRLPAK